MLSVSDEVDRCLPFFIRLCVSAVVTTGRGLDEAALQIARDLHLRFPTAMGDELRIHFEETLSDLVDLVTCLAPRLPPQTLISFAEKASQAQITMALQGALERSLAARRAES